MTASWIAYWYFSALTVLPWTRPLPVRRRLQITTIGLTVCAAILWTAWNVRTEIRYSAPLALILIGYYLSGLFFTRPTERFESWLLAWDRRLLGDPTTRFAHWPRPWLAFLDIIYMGCFLLVPAGVVALVVSGHETLIDRYWTMVTGAPAVGDRAGASAGRSRHPSRSLALRPGAHNRREHVSERPRRRIARRRVRHPRRAADRRPRLSRARALHLPRLRRRALSLCYGRRRGRRSRAGDLDRRLARVKKSRTTQKPRNSQRKMLKVFLRVLRVLRSTLYFFSFSRASRARSRRQRVISSSLS